jgi:hypothetical protein
MPWLKYSHFQSDDHYSHHDTLCSKRIVIQTELNRCSGSIINAKKSKSGTE